MPYCFEFVIRVLRKVKTTIPLTHHMLVPKGLHSGWGQFTYFHDHAQSSHSAKTLVTSDVTARGRVPPDTSHREISADLPGKKRQGKMEKKERTIEKRQVDKWKWKGESYINFFFCISLFKTTEIYFGSITMGIFYREKAFHTRKKSGKMTLPLLKNNPLTPLLVTRVPSWSITHCAIVKGMVAFTSPVEIFSWRSQYWMRVQKNLSKSIL